MFPYRLFEHEDLGSVTRWDVPINEWLGVKFEQGLHDRGGAALTRMVEDWFEDGPMISPDEANELWALPTLKFDSPIRAGRAHAMHQRKRAELDRMALMEGASHSWLSGKAAAGFGAQMLGGILHPVDFAAMFVPVVGSAAKAGGIAKLGGGPLRQAAARGLVTHEALAASTRFPTFAAGFIEGAVGNAILEVPLFIQNVRDQAIYGPEDAAINILGGGLLGGGLRSAIKGLGDALEAAGFIHRQVSPEVKDAMFREAVGQFLRDEPIHVHDMVKVDDAVIARAMEFDEAKARQEAEGVIWEREAVLKELEDAGIGRGDAIALSRGDKTVREVVGDNPEKVKQIGGILKTEQTILNQDLAGIPNLKVEVYHPSPHVEEMVPFSVHKTEAEAEAAFDALDINETKLFRQYGDQWVMYRWPQDIEAERAVKTHQLVPKAREQAIREFIEKKRAEHQVNLPALMTAARAAEVERQRAAGKILPDEEVQRLAVDDPEKAKAFLDEDVKALEQDLKADAQRRVSQDMTPEEREAIQRELDEELGQVYEKGYQPRDKAIAAAIDCVIENASKIKP